MVVASIVGQSRFEPGKWGVSTKTMQEKKAAEADNTRQPTPQLSHFSAADYKCVYEPSSDTFLFLDALEKEQNFLRDLRPTYCVEIG